MFFAHQHFEKPKEGNITLYAVFVDFSKVFDSIDQDLLWLVLTRKGVPKAVCSSAESP